LHRTSKLISDSKVLPLEHFRRPARLTWLAYSRTPTCAQFTPSVSLLCQRTYSLQDESEERELRKFPSVAPLVFTNNINHPQFTRKKCTIIYHKTMFRNASYISTSEETIWKFKFSTFHDEKNVWCSNPISWKMCSSTAAQKHR